MSIDEAGPAREPSWERLDRRGFLAKTAAAGAALAVPGVLAPAARAGRIVVRERSQAELTAASSTLYVAMTGDMQNLDPYTTSNDDVTNEMQTNIYALPLTFKVPGPAVHGVPAANPNVFMGWAADSWKWNKQRNEVTFAIPPGLKFPDGTPLDADAVKFSWDRCFDLQAVGYFLYTMVGISKKSQVQVVDKQHIKLVMPHPSALLFGNLAQFYSTAIVNPTLVKQHATKSDPQATAWLKTHTADSGPYYLKNWNVGSGWTLEANPNSVFKPKTQTVVFQVVPDAQERELLIRSGKIDFLTLNGVPVKDVAALRKVKGLTVVSVPSRTVAYVGMNVARKPFDNKLLRQAFAYATPYETIMKEVMHGEGIQLKSPIPQGTPTSDFGFWHYETNYTKAKQLLKRAGYGRGLSVQLAIAVGNPSDEQTAIWVAQGLREIGVNCTINKMPLSAYNAALQARTLPFFVNSSWVSINNDPFYHLFWLFVQNCCTYGRYQDPRIAKIVNTWANRPAGKARDAASREAQRIIVDDAPWIFLYQPPNVYVMRDNVKGFVYEPADSFTRYWLLHKV